MSTGPFRFLAPSPVLRSDARTWAADLRRIEHLGFHAVTVSEHFTHGWAMDALTAVNFALAATTRLHAIPVVLNNDLHHPGMLAKAVATADVLSSGRVGLGIGAGWLTEDYDTLGINYDPAPNRLNRLEEALQVISAFFLGSDVTFAGEHYQISALEALPSPVQSPRPPILVGGRGPRMLTMASRYADIVSIDTQLRPGALIASAAEELSKSAVDEKIDLIRRAAVLAGRPRPEIQLTCYDVNIGGVQATPLRPAFSDYVEANSDHFSDSPALLRGDVEHCIDQLVRWREELGVCYWNLGGNLDAMAPIVERLSSE